jgi:3-oxochol-4-en-24-oyl-CoA dehydrogenase
VVREHGGITDPVLRDRLVRVHVESEVLRLLRLRAVSARVRGEAPGPEASVGKLLADEVGQKLFGVAKDLAGPGGMLTDVGPLGAPVGIWHHGFLFAPALTIGGGTSQVQRNIVAERVLGLPHDPSAPPDGRGRSSTADPDPAAATEAGIGVDGEADTGPTVH